MQCWHPGALPSPKVSMCSKLCPCCVMGQDVWASVLCRTHPPPGVGAQQRLWFTATHPPQFGHPRAKAARHSTEHTCPLGGCCSRALARETVLQLWVWLDYQVNRISEVWTACSSSAGWKVEFPLSQGLQDFEAWFRLEQNLKLLKFSMKEN